MPWWDAPPRDGVWTLGGKLDDRQAADLPEGFRDLEPAAAAQRRRLEVTMLGILTGWGYREVVPALLEGGGPGSGGYLGGAAHSGGTTEGRFQVLEPGGRVWTLRPDATEALARIVAGALRASPTPLRLCYAAAVFRAEPAHSGKPRERYQVGAELIGAAGPWADAEVIAVALEALAAAGVGPVTVGLGHAALTRQAFAALHPGRAEAVRGALAGGDLVSVADLVAAARPRAWVRTFFEGTARLMEPDKGLAALGAGNPPAAVRQAVDELEAVVGAVRGWGLPGRVLVDLGLERGLDYYTGPVFALYLDGRPRPVAGGGRYDRLLSRFGRPLPAAGMALEVTELMAAGTADDDAEQALDYLVLARAREGWATAAEVATALRRQGYRTALEPAPSDLEDRLERARRAGVRRVLLLDQGGYEEIPLRPTPGEAGRH